MKLSLKDNYMNSSAMHVFLRIFAVITIVASLFLFIFNLLIELPTLTNSGKFSAKNGVIEINNYDFANNAPVYMDGEWQHFPGVYFDGDSVDESMLKDPTLVSIPITKIAMARQTASYKLSLSINNFNDDLVLYIPNTYQHIHVYVNGVEQPIANISQNWMNFGGASKSFKLTFNENEKVQEILISVKAQSEDFLMLNRSVILSTSGNISALSAFGFANSMLVLGVIIIICLNGAIFMILRPEHSLISLITLFDTMLIFRVVLGMNDLTSIFAQIAPKLFVSESMLLSLQIFTLMIAGMLGVMLSRYLFDKENKIPMRVTNVFCLIYLALAFILPFNLEWFDTFGITLLTVVYLATFVVVFLQFRIYLKKKITGYSLFQVLKTAYIGVVVFFDILYMTSKTNFLFFTYFYIVFFICHIFARLYDNNKGYKEVEFLNQNLEKIVDERTLELSRTNEILSELSIRDALTGAYNRLYFENEMETAMPMAEEKNLKLHICMFDLDYFKNINDVYGHDVGDEQLRYVVKLAQKTIGDKGMLARIGGEEFVMLFYNCKSETVLNTVEELRNALEADAKQNPKHTTASFGVVKFVSGLKQNSIMKIADKCLYAAKNQGRNRIVSNLSPDINDGIIN